MIVLGIDPGYGRMGWAIVERVGPSDRLLAVGCFETDAQQPHAVRLNALANHVRELFVRYQPGRLVIETLFFTKNTTTGLAVAEARGVVLAVAGSFICEVIEVGPKQVKMAVTGYGDADKRQVQEMVVRLLRLDAVPTPDDAADACAVALCHQ